MGSRGPSPKPKSSVRYRNGVPLAPSWLDADALKEYNRAAREIARGSNTLQRVDVGALAAYAQAWSDVGRITLLIRAEGEIVTLPNLIQTENPRLATLARAHRVMLQAASKLGFSPADRARMPKSPTSSGPNPFMAYVKNEFAEI
jgi:P27 family predicted phage terminase small subunit